MKTITSNRVLVEEWVMKDLHDLFKTFEGWKFKPLEPINGQEISVLETDDPKRLRLAWVIYEG